MWGIGSRNQSPNTNVKRFLLLSIRGGAAQPHVSILFPVMREPSTRYREVSGILDWSRERRDQCRVGVMVGAEAQLRVRGYVRKSRDVRAAKNDDR